MSGRRWRIHWAWLPAAVVFFVVGWERYGPLVAILLVAAGAGVAAYAEWRARRRSG